MSFYRTTFVAIATFFTIGMTSAALAGCGGCGGCGRGLFWGGGCGVSYAPIIYAPARVHARVHVRTHVHIHAVRVTTYAQPLAPAPIWVGGCGCGGAIAYVAGPIARTPVLVVNQGPEFSGPGLMEPYRTYTPASVYAPRAAYPYLARRWGHRPFYGARYAYGAHVFYRSRFYGPRPYRAAPQWHLYSHRP